MKNRICNHAAHDREFVKDRGSRHAFAMLVFVMLCCGCGAQKQGVQLSTAEEESARKQETQVQEEEKTENKESSKEAVQDFEEAAKEELVVYVCGAVAVPGVYTLPGGARMSEAVEAAGGMTPEADADVLNLAQLVSDGQMIRIPIVGEVTHNEAEPDIEQSEENAQTKVNINTASETELMTIPGIGQAKAKAIIAYRESKGSFGAKEDIMQIDGIKEASYAKLEPYICVE